MNIIIDVGKDKEGVKALAKRLFQVGHPKPLGENGIRRITELMRKTPMAVRVTNESVYWDSVEEYKARKDKRAKHATLAQAFSLLGPIRQFDLGSGRRGHDELVAQISRNKKRVDVGCASFDAAVIIELAELLKS